MNELTLSVLLKDPLYKAWFTQVPKLEIPGFQPNWRVLVQVEDGRWGGAKQEFAKYSEAFNWVVRNRTKYRDLVIYSKRQEFKPPVVKADGKRTYWPCPRGYRWCGFCRRPTQWRRYRKHTFVKVYDVEAIRCSICGVRQVFTRDYQSSLISKLEVPR